MFRIGRCLALIFIVVTAWADECAMPGAKAGDVLTQHNDNCRTAAYPLGRLSGRYCPGLPIRRRPCSIKKMMLLTSARRSYHFLISSMVRRRSSWRDVSGSEARSSSKVISGGGG